MTKLSDALRAMADRAPIGDLSVSTGGAARRIRRTRVVRNTANSLVGAGAVAVVALGVILPSQQPNEIAAQRQDGGGILMDEAPASVNVEGSQMWLACGSPLAPAADAQTVGASAVTALVTVPTAGEVLQYALDVTASGETAVIVGPPTGVVLWNGIVVGIDYSASYEAERAFTETPVSTVGELRLENCWDGSPLSAGEYEFVTVQEAGSQTFVYVSPDAPEPMFDDPGFDGLDIAVAPTEPHLTLTTSPLDIFYSEPNAFAIDGEFVDNPFGAYLNPVIEVPDGALTVDQVREMVYGRATSGGWDLTPGTQRTLVVSDSKRNDGQGTMLACGFPATLTSAEMSEWSPYDVAVDVPARLGLSYGWVVDDNPTVSVALTNVSGGGLPHYGTVDATFLLVQDNQVVAESYLPSVNPWGNYAYGPNVLATGESLRETFLWRDLSGCWDDQAPAEVPAGTYTVIHKQSLSYSADMWSWGNGVDTPVELDGFPSEYELYVDGGTVAPAYPVMNDYLAVEVLTSVGTITVTR